MKVYKWLKMKWNMSLGHDCSSCKYKQTSLSLKSIDHAYCQKHNSNIFDIFHEICIDWEEKKYEIPKTKIIKWDDEK